MKMQTTLENSSLVDAPVVVVGAGLSGLTAAYRLKQLGYAVNVIEARDRVGGRILGVGNDAAHQFDLGPSWFWPSMNPQLTHLLDELGLAVFAQHSVGASLMEVSATQVRRHESNYAQMSASMRIVGGTSAITQRLAATLGTDVMLDAQVEVIETRQQGLRLTVNRAGTLTHIAASAVVLALPPRVLAQSVSWVPSLADSQIKQWYRSPTWMAAQAKVVAVYKHAFWREDGLSGDAGSHIGPMVQIHDASNESGSVAALFGFVGVPYAWRTTVGEQQLKDDAQAQLVRLYGEKAAAPVALYIQDWAGDSLTAVDADRSARSQHPIPLQFSLPSPWSQQVFFAGSEFAQDVPGYLEGAVSAANNAVSRVQQHVVGGLEAVNGQLGI
tara:strand:+ start:4807 stop:5961 length:1155 start_codon:yes stop_codon:yes gene_type:complete